MMEILKPAFDDLRQSVLSIVPLTGFMMEVFAAAGTRVPDAVANDLERIRGTCLRIDRLVADLDRLMAIETSTRTADVFDPLPVLREAVATVGMPEGGTVSVPDVLPRVVGDPWGLQIALQKALENALDHHDLGDPHIEITALMTEDRLILHVADDGPGLPDVPDEVLFAPLQSFARAGRRAGGGLGLSIIRRAAEKVGGSASLINRTGRRGAILKIGYPLATTR